MIAYILGAQHFSKRFFLEKLKETADLVTFTEEILNGKLHFLRSVTESFFILNICRGPGYVSVSSLEIFSLCIDLMMLEGKFF